MSEHSKCSDHDWIEHRLHVLTELQRLNREIREMRDTNSKEMQTLNAQLIMVHTSIAGLKSDIKHKGGLYGLIAGAIPVIGLALWEVLK